MSDALEAWWSQLSAAALVGTARRPVPPLPQRLATARPGAGREVALLDAVALGAVARRAGAHGVPAGAGPGGAADDVHPPAPDRAVQLLELLLHQTPVGTALTPLLVECWLDAAHAADRRVPHHLLPALLDRASRDERLRDGVRRVGDARGAWLAAQHPGWQWYGGDAAAPSVAVLDAVAWARLPTPQRADAVTALRAHDPAAARSLVTSTWGTDAAVDRAVLLATLRPGLSTADEPLLERALDDRAARVRAVALELLDALPGSARAARMAERLRPLVRTRGLLRRGLEVALPDEPDAAGVRDGLDRPRVGSLRGWWLQRLAAGAPLELWTELGRTDPDGAWRMLTEPDARVGVLEAVLARGDRTWAAAVARDVWQPRLLALLPPGERDAVATAQLARAEPTQLAAVVTAVPGGWGPAFSRAVLQRVAGLPDTPVGTAVLATLAVPLATGLDPVTLPAVQAIAGRSAPPVRDRLARVVQHLSLRTEIPEAFA